MIDNTAFIASFVCSVILAALIFSYSQNICFFAAMVSKSRWASCLDEASRVIKPLHSFGDDYEVPMCKSFTKHSGESFFRNLHYTKDQFLTFLQSWLQQVWHLVKNFEQPIIKDVVAKNFLKEFVESIDLNLEGSVSIKEIGNVVLRHYFYLFIGERIQQ